MRELARKLYIHFSLPPSPPIPENRSNLHTRPPSLIVETPLGIYPRQHGRFLRLNDMEEFTQLSSRRSLFRSEKMMDFFFQSLLVFEISCTQSEIYACFYLCYVMRFIDSMQEKKI